MSEKKIELSPGMKKVILCLRRGGQIWVDRHTNKWLYSGYERLSGEDANDLSDFGIIQFDTHGRLSDFYKLTDYGRTIQL